MPSKHKIITIHRLLRAAGLMDEKADILKSLCNKASTKDLTETEADELVQELKLQANARRQPMRSTVIHYLCLLGYTKPGTKTPDFERINRFVEGIGSNNPRGVILNYLYYDELVKVVSQVKVMYSKETA